MSDDFGLDDVYISMYSPMSGYVFTNKQVICLWSEIVEDRIARCMFRRSGIKSAGELSRMLNHNDNTIFIAVDKDDRVLMIGWLNCLCERTARVHFMGFQRAYRYKAKNIAAKMLRTAINIRVGNTLDGMPKYLFNTLIGYTPTNNKLAIRFVKSLGCMREVGVIRNGCYDYDIELECDALVTHCTREDFI